MMISNEHIIRYVLEHPGATTTEIGLGLQMPRAIVQNLLRYFVSSQKLTVCVERRTSPDGKRQRVNVYRPSRNPRPAPAARRICSHERGEYRGERWPLRYQPRSLPSFTLPAFAWAESNAQEKES